MKSTASEAMSSWQDALAQSSGPKAEDVFHHPGMRCIVDVDGAEAHSSRRVVGLAQDCLFTTPGCVGGPYHHFSAKIY